MESGSQDRSTQRNTERAQGEGHCPPVPLFSLRKSASSADQQPTGASTERHRCTQKMLKVKPIAHRSLYSFSVNLRPLRINNRPAHPQNDTTERPRGTQKLLKVRAIAHRSLYSLCVNLRPLRINNRPAHPQNDTEQHRNSSRLHSSFIPRVAPETHDSSAERELRHHIFAGSFTPPGAAKASVSGAGMSAGMTPQHRSLPPPSAQRSSADPACSRPWDHL